LKEWVKRWLEELALGNVRFRLDRVGEQHVFLNKGAAEYPHI